MRGLLIELLSKVALSRSAKIPSAPLDMYTNLSEKMDWRETHELLTVILYWVYNIFGMSFTSDQSKLNFI